MFACSLRPGRKIVQGQIANGPELTPSFEAELQEIRAQTVVNIDAHHTIDEQTAIAVDPR
jgi:hypothetical protein